MSTFTPVPPATVATEVAVATTASLIATIAGSGNVFNSGQQILFIGGSTVTPTNFTQMLLPGQDYNFPSTGSFYACTGFGTGLALISMWPGFASLAGGNLVNAVAEFGVDNTGTVHDNSTALTNAFLAAAQGGFALYIPSPGNNQPAVVNIANTVTAGNGLSADSTVQGPVLIGTGNPGFYPGQQATPFTKGFCTLNWTGSSGGVMMQMLGPLQGFGLFNLYFYAGATNPAGTGLACYSVQYGTGQNLSFDGFTGGTYTGSNGGGLQLDVNATTNNWNTMHNYWRNLQFNCPANATGLNIGPNNVSGANVCYDTFENLTWTVAAGTGGSLVTLCLFCGRCDTLVFRDLHMIGAGGGTNTHTISWQTFGGQGFPDNITVENCDFNPGGANANGMLVPNAFSVNSRVYINNPGHDNGITYPPFGVGNIIWNDPMTVFPQSAFTQPTLPSSGTAYTNNLSLPMVVVVSGGTVSAIQVNGANTGLTSGAFYLKAGQAIKVTYSATPSWYWYPL